MSDDAIFANHPQERLGITSGFWAWPEAHLNVYPWGGPKGTNLLGYRLVYRGDDDAQLVDDTRFLYLEPDPDGTSWKLYFGPFGDPSLDTALDNIIELPEW